MSVESEAEVMARRWRWAIFWIAAAALLLFGLGSRSLWGSEGRWAEVVREMFVSGDFLHPRINWEPYFDKPLVSYWFIAACAWFKSGAVDELLARLPSALAALAALLATASLGRRLLGDTASYCGCWILLTIYSFAFWGRTAAADMENVAFTIAPLAWYFARKDKPNFLSYFVFWALCAVGGQTKGLGAIVVPAMLVGIDMAMEKSFRKHLGVQSLLAAVAGAFVYFIPFMLEAATRGDYASSGLHLVFKENVQRFFAPFDHDEPFYVYFIYLPQLFLPWTPFLLLAAIWAVRSWRSLAHGVKWLCWASLATFAIFTLSGSRRVYYILPLLPLCALLCGAWFDSKIRLAKLDKIGNLLFTIFDHAIVWASVVAAFAPFVLVFSKIKIAGVLLPSQVCMTISIGGALTLLFRTLVAWKLEGQERCKLLPPGFLRFAIPVWIALLSVYALTLPACDAFRTGKGFGLTLASATRKIPAENVFFFRKAPTDAVFYMGLKGRSDVIPDAAALEALLAKPSQGVRFMISEQGAFASLPPPLKSALGAPLVSEPAVAWDKSLKRKLALFVLPSPASK